MCIVAGFVGGILASVIMFKILAKDYFEIVDDYVDAMCKETEKSDEKVLSIIRKHFE